MYGDMERERSPHSKGGLKPIEKQEFRYNDQLLTQSYYLSVNGYFVKVIMNGLKY